MLNSYGQPGSWLIVPYSALPLAATAAETFTYDPAKANQMLTAAGGKMGADGYRTTNGASH